MQEALALLEARRPAFAVAVAHFLVKELLVPEIELGAVIHSLEHDRHERLALRGGARPGPGEDELAVRHYFLVDASAFVLVALRPTEDDAKAPADAHIELGSRHRLVRVRAP